MPQVWIPAQMRDLTGGQEVVSVEGSRVREVVDNLDRQYPGIKERLCQGDGLRPGLTVVVGSTVARLGLREAVAADAEIHFLPAIGGGQDL